MTRPTSSMRILFIGTVAFSRHCLEQIMLNNGQVIALLTLPPLDRPRFNSDYTDLRPTAEKYGIPVYPIKKISDPPTLELIRRLAPDILFVFGFSQLIPSEILTLPPKGCVGVHPTLLPRHRGRHPLIWALIHGLRESGLTFFYLDEGADSGDILWQRPFPITLEDTAATLYQKIEQLASNAIREFLPQLEKGTAPRLPQDHTLADYWPKRTRCDGWIHWNRPAMEIYNLIRALTHPYPGAETFFREKPVRIWAATPPVEDKTPPSAKIAAGTICRIEDQKLLVATADRPLWITQFESSLSLPAGAVFDPPPSVSTEGEK